MCFNKHLFNLRVRALKRLNIVKIFSHKSWHLSVKTQVNVFRASIGSIFDYSFFSLASVSDTNFGLIQRVQNRAIRCIFKLNWDSPTNYLFYLSDILTVKQRFIQLGCKYMIRALRSKNPLFSVLLNEYFQSRSEITARGRLATPLCWILDFTAFTLFVMVTIRLICLAVMYLL